MKNWFITGVSRGLGLSLAKAALLQGGTVVGTVRGEVPKALSNNPQFSALIADMSDTDSIIAAVHAAFKILGTIDVIVNNAGYGLLGTVESSTDEELRHLFEVNVYAPVRITRTAIPYLREQNSGHILNITSIAGRAPGVGIALYAATKYALEGFTTSLAQEVSPFNIKVTAVAPGQFRTDFLDESSIQKSNQEKQSYADTIGANIQALAKINHNQLGDPNMAARAILEIVESESPPLHLLLGSDALQRACGKIQTMNQEIEEWKDLTLSTDFTSS